MSDIRILGLKLSWVLLVAVVIIGAMVLGVLPPNMIGPFYFS